MKPFSSQRSTVSVAVVLLYTASVLAVPTPYFVKTTGNDANNGQSEGAAELTLGAAIADVAGAGTGDYIIYIQSGNYAGNSYYPISTLAVGTTLAIETYKTTPGDGHAVDLTGADEAILATTSADYGIVALDTGTFNTGSLTLRNIALAPTGLAGADALIQWGTSADNSPDVSIVLDKCTFTQPAGNTGSLLGTQTTDVATPATRTLTITDCVFNSVAGNNHVMVLREWASVTINNLILFGGTASGKAFIYLDTSVPIVYASDCIPGTIGGPAIQCYTDTTLGLTSIDMINFSGSGTNFFVNNSTAIDVPHALFLNNTFTCAGTAISLSTPYTNVARTGNWYGPQIIGNTFNCSGTGAHAVMVGLTCVNAEVRDNTFINTSSDGYGVVIKGSTAMTGNVSVGRYPVYLLSGTRSTIRRNTLIGDSGGAFVWGLNINNASPGATGTDLDTDGTATVTVDAGKDLSKVAVGDILQIGSTTHGLQGTNYYLITAVNDGADTITVTPTPSNDDDNQTWYTYAPPPWDATVEDNIFYGVAVPPVWNLSGTHSRIRMDRNLLYRTDAGNVAVVEGNQATLAALQAVWGAGDWTDSYTTNDDHSINADPQFVGLAAHDYRLQRSSPARGTAARRYQPIGAWGLAPVTGGTSSLGAGQLGF